MRKGSPNGRSHGMSYTCEYRAWQSMIRRCERPTPHTQANYADRGILVSPEWRADFELFYAHVGPRPSPKHSIDRIRGDGNYEPGNIRWATPEEQNRNRRTTRKITYRGEEMTVIDAMALAGTTVSRNAVWQRFKKMGWTIERALETPPIHPAWNVVRVSV